MIKDDETTYKLIQMFIDIANFLVDLYIKISNGGSIELPDFGTIFTK